jgi:hypothetical protein
MLFEKISPGLGRDAIAKMANMLIKGLNLSENN